MVILICRKDEENDFNSAYSQPIQTKLTRASAIIVSIIFSGKSQVWTVGTTGYHRIGVTGVDECVTLEAHVVAFASPILF
jgi:hypothetical protein